MEEKNSCEVPFMDLRRMLSLEKKSIEQAFSRVLESGRYILGQEVRSFEQSVARYLNVRHCLGVSSGSDALLLALMAFGVKAGDEVICPVFTFFATASSVARAGAKPVFADVCPGCFQLSPSEVQARISSNTQGIIPVHLFGQCADMEGFKAIEEKKASFSYRRQRSGIRCFNW